MCIRDRPYAILNFLKFAFFEQDLICVIMQNFIKIGQMVVEILVFFDFQDGRHPPSWIFKNWFFWTAFRVWRFWHGGNHCRHNYPRKIFLSIGSWVLEFWPSPPEILLSPLDWLVDLTTYHIEICLPAMKQCGWQMWKSRFFFRVLLSRSRNWTARVHTSVVSVKQGYFKLLHIAVNPAYWDLIQVRLQKLFISP